jgi:hypothetical protein
MSQAAYVRMYERKQAAIKYFTEQVMAPLITAAEAHTTELSTITKVIKQAKAWKEMKEYLIVKDKEIKGA